MLAVCTYPLDKGIMGVTACCLIGYVHVCVSGCSKALWSRGPPNNGYGRTPSWSRGPPNNGYGRTPSWSRGPPNNGYGKMPFSFQGSSNN